MQKNYIDPNLCLYLGELSPEITQNMLRDTLSPFGQVTSIRLRHDESRDDTSNCAYVNFFDYDSVQRVIDNLRFTPMKGKSVENYPVVGVFFYWISSSFLSAIQTNLALHGFPACIIL